MSFKTLRNLFLALVLLGTLGVYFAYQQWNKPHRDVEATQAGESLDASQLYEQFSNDEAASNEKYLDKIVSVCGKISQISADEAGENIKIQLSTSGMGGILCSLDPEKYPAMPTDLKEGQQVCLKGICTGFLMDVVLERGIVE